MDFIVTASSYFNSENHFYEIYIYTVPKGNHFSMLR